MPPSGLNLSLDTGLFRERRPSRAMNRPERNEWPVLGDLTGDNERPLLADSTPPGRGPADRLESTLTGPRAFPIPVTQRARSRHPLAGQNQV
jgi:hypothetical protein